MRFLLILFLAAAGLGGSAGAAGPAALPASAARAVSGFGRISALSAAGAPLALVSLAPLPGGMAGTGLAPLASLSPLHAPAAVAGLPAEPVPLPAAMRRTAARVASIRTEALGKEAQGRSPAAARRRSGRVFDGRRARSEAVRPFERAGFSPKFPQGLRAVRVEFARNPEDVERLIPNGENSDGLIRGMKRAVKKYGPAAIYSYYDMGGKRFVGIDLSGNAGWLDHIPELAPHERELIAMILRVESDAQVLVREAGKTPDLVVGGRVTELKSDFGGYSPRSLLAKADEQIHAFKNRHKISEGDLALHLRKADSVPVDYMEREINAWAAERGGRTSLDRIAVFADEDFAVFVKGRGGRYAPERVASGK